VALDSLRDWDLCDDTFYSLGLPSLSIPDFGFVSRDLASIKIPADVWLD
jgi:hypothetical protein